MEKSLRRTIRHQCSLVGWGLLCCFTAGQVLGALFYYIPGVRTSVVWSTLLPYVALYLISPWILWLFLRRMPRGRAPGLSLSVRALLRTWLVCLGAMYIFNYVTLGLISLLESLTGLSTGNLLDTATGSMPVWLSLIVMGVIAPIFEELIFRHLLLDRLRPLGDRLAILLSAGAFALFHLNLYQFLYAFAIGVLLAGVVVKTGKIWHSMLLHALVNLSSYLMSWLAGTEDVLWPTLLVLVLLVALCVYAIYAVIRYARTYRFAPSGYAPSGGGLGGCVLTSVGFWVCLVFCLALGTLVAFLA